MQPERYGDDQRIQEIMVLARERSYWMNMRLRNTARLCAELRRGLQPSRGQDDTWDDTVKAAALDLAKEAVARERRRIENEARFAVGKKPLNMPTPSGHPLANVNWVTKTAVSLAEWELAEDAILTRMTEIAGTLEVASFVNSEDRKGFTLAGLAVIIGHAGHPLDYPKKGHLWKRLGLAPYQKDGVTRAGSSWGYYGGLKDEDWTELGYKRSRLGDIFGKITQPLLYAQWRSTGPIGPYGEAYGRYKAAQIKRNEAGDFADEAARQITAIKKRSGKVPKALTLGRLTDAQINRRALRYMTKKLISDLWSEWRRAIERMPETAKSSLPASPNSSEQAISCVPQNAAIKSLPVSDEPNEPKAKSAVPQTEVSPRAPTAHPNERKATKSLPRKRAMPPVPTAHPDAAE